jgi:hypothetical protein
MNHFKDKLDLCAILLSFIKKSKSIHHRDIASHIFVMLVDGEKQYDKIGQHAKDFLNILVT